METLFYEEVVDVKIVKYESTGRIVLRVYKTIEDGFSEDVVSTNIELEESQAESLVQSMKEAQEFLTEGL